ncbi:MAG: hypothetical protein QNJ34_14730 [Xenococcaceae cyanobacterium MO_188.B29]|nr:hypothetical protein [Xenococcaceae cyanobacterium MO_188.B29]
MNIQKPSPLLAKIGGGCLAALVCLTGVEAANAIIYTADLVPTSASDFGFDVDRVRLTFDSPLSSGLLDTGVVLQGTDVSSDLTSWTLEAFNTLGDSVLNDNLVTGGIVQDLASSGRSIFLTASLSPSLTINGFDNDVDSDVSLGGYLNIYSNAATTVGNLAIDLNEIDENGFKIAGSPVAFQTSATTSSVPFEFSPSLGFLFVGGLVGSNCLYRKHKARKIVFDSEK